MVIYSVIPLLMIIGLLLIKKVDVKKIINGLFFGVISLIITCIFSVTVLPIFGLTPNIFNLVTVDVSLFSFVIGLIAAALPEEICKFISIKLSNAKDKTSIFINSVLVGITFASIENFVYISTSGVRLGLTRMLHPGHLFFQLLMALFLIKTLNVSGMKKKIFNILAIALPALCHATFNTLVEGDIMSYIFYAIGILTYIFTFICILKLPVNTEKYKTKWIGLKIGIIILTIMFLLIISPQNTGNKLNTNQIISEDNIELKVISSEKIEKNDGWFDGNYIKIKVELKNNNDVPYRLDISNFRLVDEFNDNDSSLNFFFEDCLTEIEVGKTEIGYLYFEDEGYDYTYLIYITGEYGNNTTYDFNIK